MPLIIKANKLIWTGERKKPRHSGFMGRGMYPLQESEAFCKICEEVVQGVVHGINRLKKHVYEDI